MADDALHRPLEQHPHVHDRFFGHVALPHEDHLDDVHGDHRHAGQHVHHDEH
jgi:hypothetical protein